MNINALSLKVEHIGQNLKSFLFMYSISSIGHRSTSTKLILGDYKLISDSGMRCHDHGRFESSYIVIFNKSEGLNNLERGGVRLKRPSRRSLLFCWVSRVLRIL